MFVTSVGINIYYVKLSYYNKLLLDINECLGTNDCHKNATCENVPGSYECTCKVKVKNKESCQGT